MVVKRKEAEREWQAVRKEWWKAQLECELLGMYLKKRKGLEDGERTKIVEEGIEDLSGNARIQKWLKRTETEKKCLLRVGVAEGERKRISSEVSEE